MNTGESDVFVIGGGPAGLATAIAARRRGLYVVVADGCTPPLDKACGEALLPDSLKAAERLGLELPLDDAYVLRGIRFFGEGLSLTGRFPDGPARGMRRTILHRALVNQAQRCGVELRWGCPVADLAGVRARWIIGADGSNSRVRAWAGLTACGRDTRRYGFRVHFRVEPWTDFIEIHWAEGCQIAVTPIASDEVGIAVLSRDPKLRVREALALVPAVASRVEGMPTNSIERGGVVASRHLRRVTRGNVALVGDASGSVDAITAEGLSLSFHHALALAEAIQHGDLSQYESAHRRLARRPRFMADFTLGIDRWRAIRKRAFPAMASRPEIFDGLLAMHVGSSSTADFAAHCLALGWRMLRA